MITPDMANILSVTTQNEKHFEEEFDKISKIFKEHLKLAVYRYDENDKPVLVGENEEILISTNLIAGITGTMYQLINHINNKTDNNSTKISYFEVIQAAHNQFMFMLDRLDEVKKEMN